MERVVEKKSFFSMIFAKNILYLLSMFSMRKRDPCRAIPVYLHANIAFIS